MANRLDLQTSFETILENENVYFDPPESIKMRYPAIRYSRKRIESKYANNAVYKRAECYEAILMYKDPDSDLPIKISQMPMCSHDRHYVSDNLHHDAFTIYIV